MTDYCTHSTFKYSSLTIVNSCSADKTALYEDKTSLSSFNWGLIGEVYISGTFVSAFYWGEIVQKLLTYIWHNWEITDHYFKNLLSALEKGKITYKLMCSMYHKV